MNNLQSQVFCTFSVEESDWYMMAYLCSLLLIAILTGASGATPLFCSDVQSPASGSGHNIDLSKVTTLK